MNCYYFNTLLKSTCQFENCFLKLCSYKNGIRNNFFLKLIFFPDSVLLCNYTIFFFSLTSILCFCCHIKTVKEFGKASTRIKRNAVF